MRQLTAAVAVVSIGMFVAACDNNKGSAPSSSSSTTTTSSKPPVAQAALAGFLLTPAEVDGVVGVTGSKSKEKVDKLYDDNAKQQWPNGWKFPDDCLYGLNPAETSVYANSGFTAVSGEDDIAALPPEANQPDPDVTQAVVLFPSADQANAFFTMSAQKWPACNDREFTTPGGGDSPEMKWKMGTASNANGVLSNSLSLTIASTSPGNAPPPSGGPLPTITCQRALTVRNNVVVDASVCRLDPQDQAVKVVGQIGAKVDKQ
jgi:hypothetical protein